MGVVTEYHCSVRSVRSSHCSALRSPASITGFDHRSSDDGHQTLHGCENKVSGSTTQRCTSGTTNAPRREYPDRQGGRSQHRDRPELTHDRPGVGRGSHCPRRQRRPQRQPFGRRRVSPSFHVPEVLRPVLDYGRLARMSDDPKANLHRYLQEGPVPSPLTSQPDSRRMWIRLPKQVR